MNLEKSIYRSYAKRDWPSSIANKWSLILKEVTWFHVLDTQNMNGIDYWVKGFCCRLGLSGGGYR